MTPLEQRDTPFFIAGGTLPMDIPSYIKRPADEIFLNRLRAGQLTYLVAPPQSGKSSLMLRTGRALQEEGIKSTIIYLSGLANSGSPEQWYGGLLLRLAFQLKLPVKVEAWWQAQAPLEPGDRFSRFMEEVVLAELESALVVFFDELETIFQLAFPLDFLEVVQKLEQRRLEGKKLTLALLGRPVSTSVRWPELTPFLPEQVITLPDFSQAEARLLAGTLNKDDEEAETIFNRIFYWSGGQPYLTQRLALALKQGGENYWSASGVDRLVERLFFPPGETEETHLQLIQATLEASPRRRKLLALAQRLGRGQPIQEMPEAPLQQELKFLGLVEGVEGYLQFRNPLYRRVFQPKTVRGLRAGWWQRAALALLLLLLLVVGGLSLVIYWQQQTLAAEARRLADVFRTATEAETRLESLAALINLPGYRQQARDLFYQELSAADRLLLFDLAEPEAVGDELLVVIQEVVGSPALGNDSRSNQLIQAMSQTLERIQGDFPGVAIDLQLELSQWLKGREYQAQGAYPEAIAAYDTALELNNRQPGLYFDRGTVYGALGETPLALANFENVLRLDRSWQARVQQVILEDSRLYTGVWQDTATYLALAETLPTATSTSTTLPAGPVVATSTSTPSPTAILPTEAPRPMATPSPTSAPSPTPLSLTQAPTSTSSPASVESLPVEMAYVTYEGGGHTLNMARVEGLTLAESQPLVLERAAGPSWSPNGRQIAFLGEVGIEHVLENAPGGSGVWLYDLATGEPSLLAEVGGLNYLNWSPDGALIAYESTKDTGQARIFFMDLAGETLPGQIPGEQPAWSPAGDQIIAKACRPDCGLWVTGLDGGNPRQVTEGGTDSFPDWRGNQVIYASERGGNWDIYQVSLAETGLPLHTPQPLTSDPAQDVTPVYAPNGQQIYFRSSRGGQWAIWVMEADGRNPQRLIVTGGSAAWGQERMVVRGEGN